MPAVIIFSSFISIIGVLFFNDRHSVKAISAGVFVGSLLALIAGWGFAPSTDIGLYQSALYLNSDSVFELSIIGHIFSILTAFIMLISVLAS
jgi:formate hydrogenlyase subunit 3/multisubunit Na+/H+ antiporter MnhD subunit